jgi:hypothetical protein
MATESEGRGTSEYGLARIVMVAGAAVDGVAILLEALKTSGHFPSASWLPTALTVVGTLAIVLAQLGYTRSRTMVKLAENAPAAFGSAAAQIPLVVTAAKEAAASYSVRTNPDGSVVTSRVRDEPPSR